MLTSIDAVVEKLGGPSAVASMAGVRVSAVSNWKARGRIPADKFLIVDRELASRNTSADPALFGFAAEAAV